MDGHGKNPEIPATRLLSYKNSLENIFEVVENEISDIRLARDVKRYLSQKYNGEKLNNIGTHFDVSGSAVSHASRRVKIQMTKDKKLKKRIEGMVQEMNLSRV